MYTRDPIVVSLVLRQVGEGALVRSDRPRSCHISSIRPDPLSLIEETIVFPVGTRHPERRRIMCATNMTNSVVDNHKIG